MCNAVFETGFHRSRSKDSPRSRLHGLKNGQLLKAAETAFDVLVTVDQSIRHQQNLRTFDIGVLILAAKTNKYDDLKPLVPRALEALKSLQPGTFVLVEATVPG